jgi:hypothetical protein
MSDNNLAPFLSAADLSLSFTMSEQHQFNSADERQPLLAISSGEEPKKPFYRPRPMW